MPAAPSPAGEGALNQGCEAGGALRRTWLPARDRTLRPWKSPAFRQLEPAAASRSPSPEQMAPRPAALTETALGRRGDRQGALRLAPQQADSTGDAPGHRLPAEASALVGRAAAPNVLLSRALQGQAGAQAGLR